MKFLLALCPFPTYSRSGLGNLKGRIVMVALLNEFSKEAHPFWSAEAVTKERILERPVAPLLFDAKSIGLAAIVVACGLVNPHPDFVRQPTSRKFFVSSFSPFLYKPDDITPVILQRLVRNQRER
jgi:hypothetical protein